MPPASAFSAILVALPSSYHPTYQAIKSYLRSVSFFTSSNIPTFTQLYWKKPCKDDPFSSCRSWTDQALSVSLGRSISLFTDLPWIQVSLKPAPEQSWAELDTIHLCVRMTQKMLIYLKTLVFFRAAQGITVTLASQLSWELSEQLRNPCVCAKSHFCCAGGHQPAITSFTKTFRMLCGIHLSITPKWLRCICVQDCFSKLV